MDSELSFDDFVVGRPKAFNLIRRGNITSCSKVLSTGYEDIKAQNAMTPNGRIGNK